MTVEKQTKNTITREWVEKELCFCNRADIRSNMLLCVAFSLISIPLAIALFGVVLKAFDRVLLGIVVGIPVGGLFLAPVFCFLYLLCVSLKKRKLIVQGEFEIVTRTVSYKSERLHRNRVTEYLHFEEFAPVEVGGLQAQLASVGDEYYLVCFCGKKKVELFYPAKMYEYRRES